MSANAQDEIFRLCEIVRIEGDRSGDLRVIVRMPAWAIYKEGESDLLLKVALSFGIALGNYVRGERDERRIDG